MRTARRVLNFVDYAYDTTAILVAKGNPDNITNLDSLAGKTVAVESGTSQQFLLQSLNTQFKSSGKTAMNILTLPDEPSALLAIKSGKAACALTDHSAALYIARTDQQRQRLPARRRSGGAQRLRFPRSSAPASPRATRRF